MGRWSVSRGGFVVVLHGIRRFLGRFFGVIAFVLRLSLSLSSSKLASLVHLLACRLSDSKWVKSQRTLNAETMCMLSDATSRVPS